MIGLTAASTLQPPTEVSLQTFFPPSPAINSSSLFIGQQFAEQDPMFGQNLYALPQEPFEDKKQLWYKRKTFLPHKDPPLQDMPPSLYTTPWTLPPQEVYAPRITYSPSITPMHVEQYPYLPGPLMPIEEVPVLPQADPSSEKDLEFARVRPVESMIRF
jgi:hypothetical protein